VKLAIVSKGATQFAVNGSRGNKVRMKTAEDDDRSHDLLVE
jgi:hypothetical protein